MRPTIFNCFLSIVEVGISLTIRSMSEIAFINKASQYRDNSVS